MKKLAVMCFGLLLAISAGSPNCWAVIFQFNGGGDGSSFLDAANWDPAGGPPDDASDRGIINDSFVVTYGTGATTTLGSLIVGADWPVTGDLGTPGTLNMSDGKLIVTGGGDNFQIGRACCAGDGAMNMTGDAELEIGGSDPIVGTRDNGVLDIGDTASVHPTTGVENYWRLGNYGPSIDAGLEGNGLLNVHDNGSFSAHVIFIGDNDATGELRVSDNGSVTLTGNLVPRPSGFQAGGSAKVQMNGAAATLSAFNLESESLAGEIPTLYEFNADPALGVSPITLTDAINITNNDLIVNLNGYALANFATLLLFDGDQALVGDRIFGTFASSVVNGSVIPHRVIYDQANGDILVQRIPEPSTMLLLGFGLMMAIGAKRRQYQ
jgi:hypothetical protein